MKPMVESIGEVAKKEHDLQVVSLLDSEAIQRIKTALNVESLGLWADTLDFLTREAKKAPLDEADLVYKGRKFVKQGSTEEVYTDESVLIRSMKAGADTVFRVDTSSFKGAMVVFDSNLKPKYGSGTFSAKSSMERVLIAMIQKHLFSEDT